MKKYVSNSTDSSRMFKSSFLESFSKIHFSVPLIVYIPIISYLIYLSIAAGSLSLLALFGLFLTGLFIWSFVEYFMHRFIFHYQPSSKIGNRLHFIFHGVHHDYPKDAYRLVLPPSVSLPLAFLFYCLFKVFVAGAALYSSFAGFLLGYLIYDMVHYALHHHTFKTGFLKRLQRRHIIHHYSEDDKGFGVSSSFWDRVFGSYSDNRTGSASSQYEK